MEINRKAHPDCVYADNPFHECAAACLEKIAQGQVRKHTKKQASRLLSFTRSFNRRNKESASPRKPQQSGSFKAANYPAKTPPTPHSQFLQRNLEKKSFSSSDSFEESSGDLYTKNYSFDKNQDRLAVPPLPKSYLKKGENPATTKQENGVEKNSMVVAAATAEVAPAATAEVAGAAMAQVRANFCFLSPPRALSNEDADDEDDLEEEGDEKEEVRSVFSDSCVSVGKYHVRADVSSVLQSILDKHGDIASNCKLQSAVILSRYLECICAVVQELQITKFENLTESEVQKMSNILKDVESVDIDVAWLRRVLDELAEAVVAKNRYQEKETHFQLMESTKKELAVYEESLVQKEKELAVARAQTDETRTRLAELESEALRFEGMEIKVQKLAGNSLINGLL